MNTSYAHTSPSEDTASDYYNLVEVRYPKHYRRDVNGTVRRVTPKLRGKAAAKAAKRARRNRRMAIDAVVA